MIVWMWLACASKKVQVETFETTWTVINETFPYEDFNGTDWNQVHETYLPQAKKAKTADELRPILNEMLSELNVSHMGVIPLEEFLDDKASDDVQNASSTEDNDSNASEESNISDVTDQGWVGLSARWIEEKLVVTAVDGRGDVQMGWTIDKIDDVTVASVAERFSDPRQQSFKLGRFAENYFYGDINESVTIHFVDHEGELQEKSLVYEKRHIMTTGKTFNLPSTGVSFVHEQVEPGIELISFSSFMMPIREPMIEAFEQIAISKPQGLIVDLRGNPGGLIALGQNLSGYLIAEKGLDLGEQVSRDANMFLVIHPRPASIRYAGPVAFLVDETSASTSEVLAGGLQELGRIEVFGQQTAGKALPSGVRALPNGDRLQYVLADLKTPSGHPYEGDGVQPDYIVPRKISDYVQGIDPELTAAVNWIKEQSTTEKIQETE